AGGDPVLAELAAGSTAALAYAEPGGPWNATRPQTRWRADHDSWVLEGRKHLVVDGASADHLVVSASGPAGTLGAFLVDEAAPGVRRRPLPTLDQTRRLAEIELVEVPARPVGGSGDAGHALARALRIGAIVLAAEQLGGAQRCLDLTVEYAKVRTQFDRPIG